MTDSRCSSRSAAAYKSDSMAPWSCSQMSCCCMSRSCHADSCVTMSSSALVRWYTSCCSLLCVRSSSVSSSLARCCSRGYPSSSTIRRACSLRSSDSASRHRLWSSSARSSQISLIAVLCHSQATFHLTRSHPRPFRQVWTASLRCRRMPAAVRSGPLSSEKLLPRVSCHKFAVLSSFSRRSPRKWSRRTRCRSSQCSPRTVPMA
mmetsp:Transcript_22696/g.51230  ORF Transcript_22696/g.51230 Transcript_22696/m.51230 type:complete len:205 (-) Transcript_22696:1087-1701(-)